MKNYLLYTLLAFVLLSCNKAKPEHPERIEIDTERFAEFEQKAKIKYEEAQELHIKRLKDRQLDGKSHSSSEFLYCENSTYIFGYGTYLPNDKMNRLFIFRDLAIDAQTGDTTELSGLYKVIEKN